MSTPASIAVVTLEEPIVRETETIAFLKLRKPKAGELRGLSMVDLVKLEVDTITELLPRIMMPPLTPVEIADLSPADLFAISTEVAGFFLPTGMMPETLTQ